MLLGQAERYRIEQRAEGVVITMDQRKNAGGFAGFILALLALSWWFSPYGPHPVLTKGIAILWAFLGFFSYSALLAGSTKRRGKSAVSRFVFEIVSDGKNARFLELKSSSGSGSK